MGEVAAHHSKCPGSLMSHALSLYHGIRPKSYMPKSPKEQIKEAASSW